MAGKQLLFRSAARERILKGTAKVVHVALENAVPMVSVLLLTEATLTEIPEKKERIASQEMAEV